MDPYLAVEALLFAAKEPVSFKRLYQLLSSRGCIDTSQELEEILQTIENVCVERAYALEKVADGFIFRTKPLFAPLVQELLQLKGDKPLSTAAKEVLAIVAYKQPITKQEIDQLRGVDSGSLLLQLQERELVASLGKKEVLGRPTLFGTTKNFLLLFGLRSIEDLQREGYRDSCSHAGFAQKIDAASQEAGDQEADAKAKT